MKRLGGWKRLEQSLNYTLNYKIYQEQRYWGGGETGGLFKIEGTDF